MPLEKINKISLTHKEKSNYDKVRLDTPTQEVPQSLFLLNGLTFSGSLTIEAAIVFPLFLFALLGILFLFQVLQMTQITWGALAATGSLLSLEAEEETSMVKAVGYFYKELLEEDCPESILVGGMMGIGWSGTVLDGEYVDLQIQYLCKFPVSMFGVGNIPVSQRVRVKKWTGYQGEEGSQTGEEIWVYITPNGEVYHRTKDCSHLQLAIETIGKDAVGALGYTPCQLCNGETGMYSYYYVTEEGSRYHTKLDCNGLKRTIYMIRISEIGDRTVCSRCGSE